MSAGSRFVLPYQTVVDNTGVPLPGAFLFFYAAGTSAPLNTYADSALVTPNANPVAANAAGVFPNIFLAIAAYKVVLTDANLNPIWTADPVLGGPPLGGGTATLASATTTDLGSVVASVITISGVATITGFGSTAQLGEIKALIFSGILALAQSSSLLLPNNGGNITTAAGDRAWAAYLGGGNWEILVYQKADGTALSASNTGAAALLASAQGMNAPLNLRINATVAGNALTVSIKTAANANPSASSPVLIPFRDSTLANGDPIIASLQAALSFTVASPNSLGTTSGNVPFRLWGIAYYNAGVPALGLFNASTSAQIFGLPEGGVVTTDASTNGGSTAGVHYANVSAITGTPFRIIGYLEWANGLATAGTWASGPTSIVLFGPGIKKPGEVIASVEAASGTSAQAGANYTPSNTLPTAANGALAVAAPAFTGQSPANRIRVSAIVVGGCNAGDKTITGYLGNGTSIVAVGATELASTTAHITSVPLSYWALIPSSAGVPSATTYSGYIIADGGTATSNAIAGLMASLWGGSVISTICVEEIMG